MNTRGRGIVLTLIAILVAALAWRFAPDLAVGDDLGEFGTLAALAGIFTALTIAARVEGRFF
jgi:hypothetical protein